MTRFVSLIVGQVCNLQRVCNPLGGVQEKPGSAGYKPARRIQSCPTSTTAAVAMFVACSVALAQSSVPLPPSGNVTLPLDEYNKLVERAALPPQRPDVPPVPYVIKSANLDLKVGDLVSGKILLEGEVLAKGEHKVPLVSGMIVVEANQNGRELPVEQDGATHAAVLAGASDFAVTLETVLPLTIETGRASFILPVPACGAARLTLTVPGDQTQVNLSPGLITNRSSRSGQTTIEATLVPGQNATLWWASRLAATQAPVAPKEVRFLSDVKTLISVSEAELAVAALAQVTVIQGEPAQFEILAPEGYELTGVTGPTVLTSEVQPHGILIKVSDAAVREHQFLISLTKSNTMTKAELPLISFQNTQRETGELLIEGSGAMELTATERGGLRRMDLKEISPDLRSLSRATLHAAFRYQKRPAERPAVALEWVRFPDGKVLSAVAQQAIVTTLVTSEGRSLTEVKLTLRNQAQPFLKVELPAGATILSAEVAGEKVKPVQGADGNRVPLLRPGLRTADAYSVSFVFLHAGAPFAKKGGAELDLPKMDLPIGRVEWEVFLPDRYKVADFGGDAIPANLLRAGEEAAVDELKVLGSGQVGGTVTDSSGAVIPRATVVVHHLGTGATYRAESDAQGRWSVDGIPSGAIRITADHPGFRTMVRDINHDGQRSTFRNLRLDVGSVNEAITVEAEVSSRVQTSNAEVASINQRPAQKDKQKPLPADQPASANVFDLQRRVAGVLPIAVSVPRAGSSYRFVRPLVIDEETKLTFSYRSR
jgi:hypothetical protein